MGEKRRMKESLINNEKMIAKMKKGNFASIENILAYESEIRGAAIIIKDNKVMQVSS